MKASIIIPTLNEEVYLPKLLSCLRKQIFHDFEIIVADAISKDKTRQIARRFGAKIIEGGVPAVGRNRGARASSGEFLFFFDADVKVRSNFIEKALSEMEKRYLDLATCEIFPLSNYRIDQALHKFANLSVKVSQFSDPHAGGMCIIVTRRLFNRVGGFNESLALAEDHDFVKRASRIRPLRVLRTVSAHVSVRRLREEGRFTIAKKYLRVEFERMFRGELRTNVVPYRFGEHGAISGAKLHTFEKRLNKIDREYRRFVKGYLKGDGLGRQYRMRIQKFRSEFQRIASIFVAGKWPRKSQKR